MHKDNRARFEEKGNIKPTQDKIEDQLKGELMKELIERNSFYQTQACVSVVDSNCSFPSDDIRPLISWNFLPV
jgi:chorismate mutase